MTFIKWAKPPLSIITLLESKTLVDVSNVFQCAPDNVMLWLNETKASLHLWLPPLRPTLTEPRTNDAIVMGASLGPPQTEHITLSELSIEFPEHLRNSSSRKNWLQTQDEAIICINAQTHIHTHIARDKILGFVRDAPTNHTTERTSRATPINQHKIKPSQIYQSEGIERRGQRRK